MVTEIDSSKDGRKNKKSDRRRFLEHDNLFRKKDIDGSGKEHISPEWERRLSAQQDRERLTLA